MSYFSDEQYLVRKKIIKLLGDAFHIYDMQENVVAYSKLKAFKLKEDIRVYTNESMQEEIFCIQARSVIDFSATYDVLDSKTNQKIGALRRKGMKSLIKDEWLILDTSDNEIGIIEEDSMGMALLRRFLCNLVPQTYHCKVNNEPACTFKQNFNPFVVKINVTFHSSTVDRSLIMAGGVLLCAIESKQN